jgi:hypothetical protein
LNRELKSHKKGEDAIANDAKAVDWKIKIAIILRQQTTAKNPWIAERLSMGHPSRVTNLVRESRE